MNVRIEISVLRNVFGTHTGLLAKIPAHSLEAAGALKAAATPLIQRHQIALPTVNFEERNPERELGVIPNMARPMPMRAAIPNSLGGLNAVLCSSEPDGNRVAMAGALCAPRGRQG
jgi:nodulation protein E